MLILSANDRISSRMTTVLVGQSGKPFIVHTELLLSRSPFFRDLLSHSNGNDDHDKNVADIPSYADLDEFSFALFVRWLYGAALTGPNNFSSMNHYIGLYVLARRFRIERLENTVMDLIRYYYRSAEMTAPPYRLDYIYDHTHSANLMRAFLVSTAAYRVLCEDAISDVMLDVVRKGGDRAVDFTEQLVKLHADGLVDARRGDDCA